MSIEKWFAVKVRPNAVIDELKDIVDIRFIQQSIKDADWSGGVVQDVKEVIALLREISEAFQFAKISNKMTSEQIIEKGVECLDVLFEFKGIVGKIVEAIDQRFYSILLTAIYEMLKNKYGDKIKLNLAIVKKFNG